MLLDLHTHSTASDGSETPAYLLQQAGARGFEVLSITDHDTVEAYDDISPADVPADVVLVPGVEISAESPGTLHILGYGIDTGNAALRNALEELQSFRAHRNEQMIANMQKLGFAITMEDLRAVAGNEIVGRPHFARLMYEKGYVESFQEAFDRYLKKGAPLYMNKRRLDPERSIRLIRDAGGIAVMAHPYQTKLEGDELRDLVAWLAGKGLQGIEAFYSLHTPELTETYLGYAAEFGLMVTAGSDFHGTAKPEIRLGMEVPFARLHPFLREVRTLAGLRAAAGTL